MLALDVMLACMLFITVWFCYRLNKKIVELQKGKRELAKLFQYFDALVQRIEGGIETLKASTHQAASQLKEAESLRDDLALMLARGSKLADILEAHISKARKAADSPPPSYPSYPQQTESRPREIERSNSYYSDPRHTVQQVSTPHPPLRGEEALKKIAIQTLLEKISAVQNAND